MPGATAGGVIVDRRYAELVAGQDLGQVTQEVWLAAGAAILGVYLSARRRRYEFAALEGSGVRRRTLGRAVLIELMVVLGFGALAGIGAGLAGAAAVLRSVPEFTTSPSAPALSYVPPAGPLAIALGAAVGLLIIASVATGVTLIRGVRLDQLREAPV